MIFRKLLRPFAPFPYTPGQWYSPLDAGAEAMGVSMVERAFKECAALPRLAEALGRLIGDGERGRLALKKALHGSFESRLRILALRADPPQRHGFGALPLPTGGHPLDFRLGHGLGIAARPTRAVERLWHWIEVLTLAIALVCRAVGTAIRFGRWHVVPRRCRLLALNAWPESRWIAIAAALAEHAGFKRGDLLAEVNTAAKGDFAVIPTLRPSTLPVAVGPWLRHAILGSAWLAGAALAAAVASALDPRAVEGAAQALRLANRALDARRLAGAVRFETCLDNAEYDPRHILVGAFAPGACIARLPHSEMDMPGVGLSYLGYRLFLSGGTYQFDAFGRTWNGSSRGAAVGALQDDRRVRSPVQVDTEHGKAIETELSRGRRMAVVFGVSDIAGIWPLFTQALDVVLDAVAGREDWFVVIKPKGSDRLYMEATNAAEQSRRLQSPRVIRVRYPTVGRETCSPAYLIDKMTLGVCLGGSILIEALCRRRVAMAYYPVVGDTPLRQKLRQLGLLHSDAANFRVALSAFLNDPSAHVVPFAWFRERFDPFGDDRALDRMAAVLYPLRQSETETPPPARAER